MSAITNTFISSDSVGNREDLSDVISNISPTDTPFITGAGSGPAAQATLFEWQIDVLAAAVSTNAQPEGDDHTTFAAVVPTDRVGNVVQISSKDVIVSGTQEKIKKAGRKSEKAYQIAKKAKELKRDIETTCLANRAASTADTRKTATLLAHIQTNTNFGGGAGADPAAPGTIYAGVRVDGTQRALTEALLKDVISQMYTSGAEVDGATIMLGAFNKQVASGFDGIATVQSQAGKKVATIVAAADVYVSDFGTLSMVPNRFQRSRDALVLDFEQVALRDLRPYEVIDLAKTGDADKKLIQREWGLQVTNEAGLGGVFDLTTS